MKLYTCVFVMEPSEGYEPYICSWDASCPDDAMVMAWSEVEREWDLEAEVDWELPRTNDHGTAYMAACVSSESKVKVHSTFNGN